MAVQAIETSYNFKIVVNSVDMSDHCKSLKVNYGQGVNEISAGGMVHKQYRAAMGDFSIEATFNADDSTGGVSQTLRNLISPLSTGVTVTARRINTTRTSANPDYTGEMTVNGDLMAMDDQWGEVPTISVKFCPVNTFTIVSTAT